MTESRDDVLARARGFTECCRSCLASALDGDIGRYKVKCKLQSLVVGHLPLEVSEQDMCTVAMGSKVIFSCLTDLSYWGDGWCWLESKLGG